jgi:hypothetical protein
VGLVARFVQYDLLTVKRNYVTITKAIKDLTPLRRLAKFSNASAEPFREIRYSPFRVFPYASRAWSELAGNDVFSTIHCGDRCAFLLDKPTYVFSHMR